MSKNVFQDYVLVIGAIRNENRTRARERDVKKASVRGSFSPRCWRSALTSSHCEPRVKMLLDSILSFFFPRSPSADPLQRGPTLGPVPPCHAPAYAAYTHTNACTHTYGISLWGPCLTLRSPKIPSELRAPSRAANRTEIITGRWACVDCSYSASLTDSEKLWGRPHQKSTRGNHEEFYSV